MLRIGQREANGFIIQFGRCKYIKRKAVSSMFHSLGFDLRDDTYKAKAISISSINGHLVRTELENEVMVITSISKPNHIPSC